MDLTHTFTVPTGIDATWEHFGDIAGLAACFPGAQVTAVGEDDTGAATFEGTCKVKLGPIALVYAGAGRFVERDEAAHRFVVDAKGRDKRGNGTAGATVSVAMSEDGDGATRIEVVTDLAITGKPAQFGRGVMQDVSDKLLAQFVTCLEQRLREEQAAPDAGEAAPAADESAATDPTAPAAAATPRPTQRPAPVAAPAGDDALDLGSAVLPVLLRSYGPKIVAGLAALLVLRRLLRRG